jgi:hypothetical protein
MSLARFKLVFFVPRTATKSVLKNLFAFDPERIGAIGNYRSCAFFTSGTGQFLPVGSANPTVGQIGEMEYVEEDRVEVSVKGDVRSVVDHLRKVMPCQSFDIPI